MTAEEMGGLIVAGRGAVELPSFLAAGGDVNAIEPRSGMPLLPFACEHRNFDVIRALVGAGAAIDARDAAGQAALHVAVDIDIDTVVQADGLLSDTPFDTPRLMLSLGADPDARDASGRTPREWAAGYGDAALGQFDRRTGVS